MPLHSKRVFFERSNVAGKNETCLGLHVKCSIFLPDYNQIWIFIKSSISRVTEVRQKELRWYLRTDGQTEDMTKLMDALRDKENVPKKEELRTVRLPCCLCGRLCYSPPPLQSVY
jgi:hypothetical protein